MCCRAMGLFPEHLLAEHRHLAQKKPGLSVGKDMLGRAHSRMRHFRGEECCRGRKQQEVASRVDF